MQKKILDRIGDWWDDPEATHRDALIVIMAIAAGVGFLFGYWWGGGI